MRTTRKGKQMEEGEKKWKISKRTWRRERRGFPVGSSVWAFLKSVQCLDLSVCGIFLNGPQEMSHAGHLTWAGCPFWRQSPVLDCGCKCQEWSVPRSGSTPRCPGPLQALGIKMKEKQLSYSVKSLIFLIDVTQSGWYLTLDSWAWLNSSALYFFCN